MASSAIVVPGSSVVRVRERLVRAAERLARDGRVVVFSGLDEAEHMRSIWRGPEVELVVENTATSTVENAARTLPLLLERDVDNVLVVCAPAHLVRARWIFRRIYGGAGIGVRFRAARVWPTPGALAWELAAAAVARRQVRPHLRR
ncbi:MAG TPA: YdcF family protein [Gaiellaceae bacterium]|nr:YdcF family protein [Gaiellaceae bacterium]